MRKIIYTTLVLFLALTVTPVCCDASLISDRAYRAEVRRENKENIKQIKDLFVMHTQYANEHDLEKLKSLYSDNFINSDGFDKKAYFKSIKETWDSCENISYTTKITSFAINGDYASINVEETATGTIFEKMLDQIPIAGEIHSKSEGLYHLVKVNGKWYINGETAISDESSLLYGDARFMNIEIQAPSQVASGETYSVSMKIDADDDTYMMGSIDHDPVTYPTNTPKPDLRPVNKSKTLERYIKANENNLNEYAVASVAISKIRPYSPQNVRIYMAGLACLMKRVNVIPKNNFIKVED